MACEPVRYGVQQGAHNVIAPWLTYVGRAQTHGLGPEFVVGQPVSTDDAEVGKLAMQTVNFIWSRRFQIQYQSLRTMPGNGEAHFLASADQMNKIKMLGKTNRKNLRNSGVVLVEDHPDGFHITPRCTAISRRPWLPQQTAGTGVISSESRQRYLHNTFSARGTVQFAACSPF
jgi:hypothetical protein